MKSVAHGLILGIIVTLAALWGSGMDWASAAEPRLAVSLFDPDDYTLGCRLLRSAADIELHCACTRWR